MKDETCKHCWGYHKTHNCYLGTSDVKRLQCWYCTGMGHIMRHCPKQAHDICVQKDKEIQGIKSFFSLELQKSSDIRVTELKRNEEAHNISMKEKV